MILSGYWQALLHQSVRKSGFLLCRALLLSCLAQAQPSRIDSLENVLATRAAEDENTVKTMRWLADDYARTNQTKAKMYAQQELALSQKLNLPQYTSAAYSTLVTLNQNMGLPDSAQYYLDRFADYGLGYRGEKENMVKGNYHQSAGLYYKNIGLPNKAVPYFEQAIHFGHLQGERAFEAGAYLNLGNTYSEMGQHRLALTQRLEALRIFETIGNERGQSFCLNGIGTTFQQLKQYDRALEYAKRSLQMKEKLQDTRGLQTGNALLGEIYMGLKRYGNAFERFIHGIPNAKRYTSHAGRNMGKVRYWSVTGQG